MLLIILIIASLLMFLLFGELLNWTSKIFKLEGANYKRSLIVLLGSGIVTAVAYAILVLIKLGFVAGLLNGVLEIVAYHFLLRHFYKNGWLKSLGVWALSGVFMAIASVILVFIIRAYIIEPFSVAGNSMVPAYNSGDYLLVAKWPMQYQRGDVVIAEDPQDPSTFLIKRIIGLPGETVTITDGKVSINGTPLNEPYLGKAVTSTLSVTLNGDQYFLFGDNPSQSFDSRNFGGVGRNYIRGKVIYKLYPNPYNALTSFEQNLNS